MKLSLTKTHTSAAAIAGVVLCANAIANGAFGWRHAPAPFVWLDVAAVYFLAALPLAASLALAALLQLPRRTSTLAILGLEAIVLIFIPRLYIHARCQSDLKEAIQLAGDFRYGESRALLHRLLALHSVAQFHGRSLAAITANMDQIVHELEIRVAEPLAGDATDADGLNRAETLAMLGRTNEAIAVLNASPTLADLPAACNLRGTIHETRGQWQAARDWYARVKATALLLDDSPIRSVGLERATRGIAFSERKLGHLHQAEAAWQELLALSPTADAHFLLAQFYEDTQQAAKAQLHARQAMTLAPDRYAIPGQQLLDKLLTSHFGCFGQSSPLRAPTRSVGR